MCAILRIRFQNSLWFDLNSATNILIMCTQYLHGRVLISAFFYQVNTDSKQIWENPNLFNLDMFDKMDGVIIRYRFRLSFCMGRNYIAAIKQFEDL